MPQSIKKKVKKGQKTRKTMAAGMARQVKKKKAQPFINVNPVAKKSKKKANKIMRKIRKHLEAGKNAVKKAVGKKAKRAAKKALKKMKAHASVAIKAKHSSP